MFFKKSDEEAPKASEEAAPNEKTGAGLGRINLLSMLVGVALILAAGYVSYLQYASALEGRQEDSYQAQANRMAARLSGRVAALGEEVQRRAEANSELLGAIAAGDSEGLRDYEQEIAQLLPGTMRVRVILPGELRPDNSVEPALSYACLELARLAEKGTKRPPFEVHWPGAEDEHVDVVRPIRQGESVVASLMVTFGIDMLERWFKELKPDAGYTELQQGAGNDAVGLLGRGNEALRNGAERYSEKVGNSQWAIVYWPESTVGEAEARTAGFIVTFAVAAGIMLLFSSFFGLFLSRMVFADMQRMVKFIVDSSLGKRFHSYPVKLAESKKALMEKEGDLAVLASQASGSEAVHNKAEEFLPDITFGDDDGIMIEEEEPPPHEGQGEQKPESDKG